jgi:hypothetical protein
MSDEATEGTAAKPALRTLADKMNWLIDGARPAGRGPYTNAEVSSAHTTDRRGSPANRATIPATTWSRAGSPRTVSLGRRQIATSRTRRYSVRPPPAASPPPQ